MANDYLYDEAPGPEHEYLYSQPTDSPSVPPSVAQERAKKYDYALGDSSPGIESLSHSIQTGYEDYERSLAAQKMQLRNQDAKIQLLDEYTRTVKTPDRGEVDFIMNLGTQDIANPDSAMEKLYARRILNETMLASSNPTLNEALQTDPESVHRDLDSAEWLTVRKEAAQKILEGLQEENSKRGWGSWGYDFAESLFPFNSWRDWNSGIANAPSSGPGLPDFPGNSRRAQFEYLNMLPPDEAIAELKSSAETMKEDNLLNAITFFEDYLQYSGSSQVMDNILIGGVDLLGVGSALKGAFKLVRSARNASRIAKATGEVEKAASELPTAPGAISPKSAPVDVTPKGGNTYMSKGEQSLLQEFQANLKAGMTPEDAYAAATGKGAKKAEVPEAPKVEENPSLPGDDRLRPEERAYDAAKATPQERQRRSVRDILKAIMRPKTEPEDLMAAAGHSEEAIQLDAVKSLRERIAGQWDKLGAPGGFGAIAREMPGVFNPRLFVMGDTKAFTREGVRRILQSVTDSAPQILKALAEGIRVQRIDADQEVLDLMVKQASDRVKMQYPGVSNRIMDAIHHVDDLESGSVNSVEVMFGDENAQLYKSAMTAINDAEVMGLKDYRVKQQGAGYYLSLNKTIDETDPLIRNVVLDTDNATPQSLANWLFGTGRTADELIAPAARRDRKVAVAGIGELSATISKAAPNIASLSSKSRKKMLHFIENDRVAETTVMSKGQTETRYGQFAKSLSELSTRWYDTFGRFPTEKEASAYIEYVRLNELDWAIRNSRVYVFKARLGIENFEMFHTNPMLEGKPVTQFWGVEGRTVQDIPWESADNAGILILRDGEPKFVRLNDARAETKEMVEKFKAEGAKIVQVTEFGNNALKTKSIVKDVAGENDIHYVIADKATPRALPVKQLPYRPGGHHLYPDGFYVAQPRITSLKEGKELRYDGDKNIMFFSTRAKGTKFKDALEKTRQMLKAGEDTAAIKAHIERTLPRDAENIIGLFTPRIDEKGVVVAPAQLSLDHPLGLRSTGERLKDSMKLESQYPGLQDRLGNSHNLLGDMAREYTGIRDGLVESIEETGTERNPIFKRTDAKMVDAWTTMNRAIRGVIDAKYLDDIKIKETERFIREFAHTVQNVSPSELRNNPIKYLFQAHVPWNNNLPRQELQAAKNSLAALKQFLGTATPEARGLQWIQSKLMDSIYKMGGDKGVDLVEPWLLPTISDPLKYARSMAFHLHLGLLNPVQYFLQAQTLATMAAIVGPVTGTKGLAGATLAQFLRYTDNPKIINQFASYASKLGWKGEDFKEAYSLMREAGWDRVGKEVAQLDDALNPKLVKTKAGKVVDWSLVFFNGGERLNRTGAYMAAYQEWRSANPLAKVTSKIKGQLLDRADLMSGNMTRASNAFWQKGLLSIPTQFFSYQARIVDLLAGKRLTPMEKLRVTMTNAALYGLPVAGSAWVGVWPLQDEIKAQLKQRNIKYDDNIASQVLMDGIVSTVVEGITGTKYNIGQRYGPGGVDAFRDFFTSHKDGQDIITGVAGSTLGGVINKSIPVLGDVADLVTGNRDAGAWLVDDMYDLAKQASTVKNVDKMITGMYTGKYISEKENYLTDVTPEQSLFMGVLGLTPEEVNDAFTTDRLLDSLESTQKEAGNEAVKYIRRGLQASDSDEKDRNWNRAQALMESAGMDINQRREVFSRAVKNWESLVDAKAWEWARSSPERMQDYIENH